MLRRLFYFLLLFSFSSYSRDSSNSFLFGVKVSAESSFNSYDFIASSRSVKSKSQDYMNRYYYTLVHAGLGYSINLLDNFYYTPILSAGKSLNDFEIKLRDNNAASVGVPYKFYSNNTLSLSFDNEFILFKNNNSDFFISGGAGVSALWLKGNIKNSDTGEIQSSSKSHIFYLPSISLGFGYVMFSSLVLNLNTSIKFSKEQSTSSYGVGLSYGF